MSTAVERPAESGRPLVKVCGVTRPGDAELAVSLGADLLGLNFYPPSPRCLSVEAAREIAAAARSAARGRVILAGVFVDRSRAEVEEIAGQVGLDLIQLHGDEGPEEVAAYGGRAIKVFRVAPQRSSADRAERAIAGASESLPPALLIPYPAVWGYLFDVRHERLYGGTGRGWRYGALAGLAAGCPRPVLVAGGIRPGNALTALAASGAAGVDVCSGVESAPGVKDPLLLERLMAEVRSMPESARKSPANEPAEARDG